MPSSIPVFGRYNTLIGIPWGPVAMVPADTDLATLGYSAIASETGFTVYWGDDSSNMYNWPAHTAFVIHPTAQPKLQSSTLCAIID